VSKEGMFGVQSGDIEGAVEEESFGKVGKSDWQL